MHSLSMKIRLLLKCCVGKSERSFTTKHPNNSLTHAPSETGVPQMMCVSYEENRAKHRNLSWWQWDEGAGQQLLTQPLIWCAEQFLTPTLEATFGGLHHTHHCITWSSQGLTAGVVHIQVDFFHLSQSAWKEPPKSHVFYLHLELGSLEYPLLESWAGQLIVQQEFNPFHNSLTSTRLTSGLYMYSGHSHSDHYLYWHCRRNDGSTDEDFAVLWAGLTPTEVQTPRGRSLKVTITRVSIPEREELLPFCTAEAVTPWAGLIKTLFERI